MRLGITQAHLVSQNADGPVELFRLIPLSNLPREWFTRAWTFQELVLANYPVLVCGFSSSPWNEKGFLQSWRGAPFVKVRPSFLHKHPEFVACVARIFYYGLRKRFAILTPDQLPPNTLRQKALRKDILTGKTIDPSNPKLLGVLKREDYTMAGSMDPFAKGILNSCQILLIVVFQRKTGDARDVVFSLHGIMSDLNFRLPEPDYSLPVPVIYENFAVSIMRRTSSLFILTALLGVFGTPEWPSWVPDLSKEDPEPDSREPPLRNLLWWDDNVTASGCRFRPSFQLVHQPGRLTVEGIKFATIASIESILCRPTPEQLEEPGRRGRFIFDAVCWLKEILEAGKHKICPDGDTHRSAFYKTLDALEEVAPALGVTKPGINIERMAPTWLRDLDMVDALLKDKKYSPLLDQHRDEVAAAGTGLPQRASKTAVEKLFSTRNPTSMFVGGALARMADLCYASPMRVPLVLSNGSVGMGYMPDYQVGDCVVFMYGSHLPIAIRPHGDAYRFIGPAVVGGIPKDLWPLEHGKDQGEVELITLI